MNSPRTRTPLGASGSVTLAGVSKTFQSRRRGVSPVEAIQPTELQIRENDFVTVVGPASCGKTTLLRLVAGLEPPTGGKVLVDGLPISGPGADRGIVFQSDALFPWLSVHDNIAFGLKQREAPPHLVAARVEGLVAEMGLQGFEGDMPGRLSAGMRKRVALARALAPDPKILLLDDPFGALDPQTRGLMQEFLLGVWERHRKTVLCVTLDIEEAIFMSNRVVVLTARPGRVKREFAIDLPYPRHYSMKTSGRFADYKSRIAEELRSESLKSTQIGPQFLGT